MNYLDFFESIEKFIRQTDAKSKVSIIGLKDDEINTLEGMYGGAFPHYLTDYLNHFGVRFSFYSKTNHEYFLSGQSIAHSLKLFQTYKIETVLTKIVANNLPRLIPMYHDEMRSQMILLNPQSESGEMFRLNELNLGERNEIYDPEDIELTPYLSFFNNIRERLFLEIKHVFYPNRKSDDVDLSSIDWTKFHLHYHTFKNKYYNIGNSRKEFTNIMNAEQSFDILGFDEYEILFIRYLIEEKGVPPIPYIYDAYR